MEQEDNPKEDAKKHEEIHYEVHKHSMHHEHSENNEQTEKKPMSSINYYRIIAVIAVITLLIVAYSTYNLYKSNKYIEDQKNNALEDARPAEISIIEIKDKACIDCFDILPIIEGIKQNNVKITNEKLLDYPDKEASNLIVKYKIDKVPAVIVMGEIDKIALNGFVKKDDALISSQITAPYKDVASNEIKGYVSAIIINAPSCDNCFNVTSALDQLKTIIKVNDEKVLDYSDKESRSLVDKYSIKLLPTMILSKDIFEYTEINKVLEKIGTEEDDGSYVLRDVAPPYYNVSTRDIKGLVKMTALVDKACIDCYNVSVHKQILARFNLIPYKEDTIDISSDAGKEIIKKYNIKNVPTVILSKEAIAYNVLNSVWSQVGSIESDGVYIFRNIDVLKLTYKDLSTNKTVEGQPQQ